jgi:hypothetical protein
VGLFYEENRLFIPGKSGGAELGAAAVAESLRLAFLDLFRNFISPTSLLPKNDIGDFPAGGFWSLTILLAMMAWFLCTTKRWGVLHAAWSIVLLEVLAGGVVWCNLLHYQAPIVCLCYFLAVDWLRRATLIGRRRRPLRIVRTRHAILAFMVLIPAVLLQSRLETFFSSLWASQAEAFVSERPLPSSSPALTRPQLLEFLARQERPALALVSYDGGVPLYEEWVYNSADLESQRVILAHNLRPNQLPLLIADFPHRDVWRVHITPKGANVIGPGKDGRAAYFFTSSRNGLRAANSSRRDW